MANVKKNVQGRTKWSIMYNMSNVKNSNSWRFIGNEINFQVRYEGHQNDWKTFYEHSEGFW